MKEKKKKIIFIAGAMLFAVIMSVITAFVVVNITDKDKDPVTDVLSTAIENEKAQSPDNGIVKEKINLRKETLSEIITPAQELVSSKYYYTNASDIENYKTLFDKKVPLTTDHVVFTYDGVIMAGVDLDDVVFKEIDNEHKKIYITMPQPKIISHVLDMSSFNYYDVKNSIFTSISPNEITTKYDELKKLQEDKLLANEDFWDSVSENAEMVVERFIKASDEAKEYDVIFE